LKKMEMVSPDILIKFKKKHNLTDKDIADFTHSGHRSVQRWVEDTGIPISKFELLQSKVKNAGTQS
jgi:hypothetical protein